MFYLKLFLEICFVSSTLSCSADVLFSRSVVYGRYAWVQNVTSAFSEEVFFRSLCQIVRFVLFMFMFVIHYKWLSADVFSSFLLCLFCLFTPRIAQLAQLYLKQIVSCCSRHNDLVVYRSATCSGSTTAAIAVTYRSPPSLQLHRLITGGFSK